MKGDDVTAAHYEARNDAYRGSVKAGADDPTKLASSNFHCVETVPGKEAHSID